MVGVLNSHMDDMVQISDLVTCFLISLSLFGQIEW